MWLLLLGWLLFCLLALWLWHQCCVRGSSDSPDGICCCCCGGKADKKYDEKWHKNRKRRMPRHRNVHWDMDHLERGERRPFPNKHGQPRQMSRHLQHENQPATTLPPTPPSSSSSSSQSPASVETTSVEVEVENEETPTPEEKSHSTPSSSTSPPCTGSGHKQPHLERLYLYPLDEEADEEACTEPGETVHRFYIRLRPLQAGEQHHFGKSTEAPEGTPRIVIDELCSVWRSGGAEERAGERELHHLSTSNITVWPGTAAEGVLLVQRTREHVTAYSEWNPEDFEEDEEEATMTKANISSPSPSAAGGFAPEELEKMPADYVGSDIHLDDRVCPICLEPFTYGQRASQSDCGPLFHQDCISAWLQKQRTCPICHVLVDPEKWT